MSPIPKPTAAPGRAEIETDVFGVPALVVDSDTGPLLSVQLLCVAGQELGKSFSISEIPVTIGRQGGEVCLHAADVSRTHARISRRGRRFWIEDLESANGTYINGVLITDAVELSFGDRVQVGSTILVFTRNDELEQRLREFQKLEAMHDVVKGIAHDFNNTLQVLLCGLEEISALDSRKELQAIVSEMEKAANSGTGLVRRLLRIGRNKPATLDLVELDAVVRDSVVLARRVMPPEVQVEILGGAAVLVRGSRSELEQALLNVLLNARDAMTAGRITVEAKVITLDRVAAHEIHLHAEGRFVQLDIRDEGAGMDADTLARAFEPFFTTKSVKGTGLGLSMVYSTVKNHGGAARLESAPNAGTLVRLWLPVIS